MGFVYQMQQFQEERLWGAISAVVGMERLIDQTIEYTRERKVFGRPLLDNQVIHFKLAELRTEIELVRSLCYRACEEYLELRFDLCQLCTKVTDLLEEVLLRFERTLELDLKSGYTLLEVILVLIPLFTIKKLFLFDIFSDIVVSLEAKVRFLLVEVPSVLAETS
jgi:hypothetical protein